MICDTFREKFTASNVNITVRISKLYSCALIENTEFTRIKSLLLSVFVFGAIDNAAVFSIIYIRISGYIRVQVISGY